MLVGGSDGLQAVVLIGQQDADGGDVDHFHAAHGQLLQEVDEVEAVDQGFGGFHENLGDALFAGHSRQPWIPSRGSAWASSPSCAGPTPPSSGPTSSNATASPTSARASSRHPTRAASAP